MEACIVVSTRKTVRWGWIPRLTGREGGISGSILGRDRGWHRRNGRGLMSVAVETSNETLLHWPYMFNGAIMSAMCGIVCRLLIARQNGDSRSAKNNNCHLKDGPFVRAFVHANQHCPWGNCLGGVKKV